MKTIIANSVFLLLFIYNTYSQKFGSPLIVNYTPKEYHGHNQVWAITEDNRGVMYFGTTTELLEFDGQNWRSILLPNSSNVRSLCTAKSGKIYVGGSNEIGYVDVDSTGKTFFHSLKDKLDSADYEFTTVWETFEGDDGIYFRSTVKLYRYDENTDKIYAWTPKVKFNPISYVPGIGIIGRDGDDFFKIIGDSIIPISQPKKYYGDFIYRFFPYDNGRAICVTANKLLLYNFLASDNEDPLTDFHTDIDSIFKNTHLYMGCTIGDSTYAITTLSKGVFIINKKGKLLETIDKNDGLQYDDVWFTYLSSQGTLWFGLDKGISRADYTTDIRVLSKASGFDETTNSVIRKGDNIYAATMTGVYKIPISTENKIIPLNGINYNTWYFNYFKLSNQKNNKFLVSTSQGVFEIKDINANLINDVSYNYYVMQSKYNNHILYTTTLNGIIAFKFQNNTFAPFDTLQFNGLSVRCFEDNDSNLWISTFYNGIYKVKINPYNDSIFEDSTIEKYDTLNAFKDMRLIKPFIFKDNVYFCSLNGLKKYNKKNDTIVSTSDFTDYFLNSHKDISYYTSCLNAHFFIQTHKIVVVKNLKGKLEVDDSIYNILNHKSINFAFIDSLQNVYFTGFDGIFITKYPFIYKKTKPKKPLINKIILGHDTLYGAWKDTNGVIISDQNIEAIKKLKYSDNSVEFFFSAPVYILDAKVKYSYQLIQFDKEWSDWSEKATNKYTNLREGKYTFEVKSLTATGEETEITRYQFEILPPWYRTYWAYTAYIVFAIIFILILLKLNSRRLKAQNIKLEKIVKKRTRKIATQNEELKQLAEEIATQRDELAAINVELEKLSVVASHTDSSVFIINESGDFIWANEAFEIIYGITYQEFIAKHKNLFDYYEDSEFAKNLRNQLLIEKKSIVYESHIENNEGKTIWLQTNITPILDAFGEIKMLAAIEIDITKIKEYEKKLEENNEEIQRQNFILNEKNELIESSIRYARTIQQAILPSINKFEKYFDTYILYRPKDVVSGDFYWLVEKGKYLYIAVADCTGHGVPGAFMSLISSRIISSIIIEKNIESPGDILNELDNEIISSLDNEKKEIKDGLDIALCRFEKKDNKIKTIFSGAKRPLFMYNSESKEIVRYKGTIRPIGGYGGLSKTFDFEEKELNVKKDDILFLSSDGYTDQNNHLRRKFSTTRFQKVLQGNINKSIYEQGEMLNNELDKWMEGELQRDDITIIILKRK